MSEFMLWLYTHYISPHLETIPQGDYEIYFDSFFEETTFRGEQYYNKITEFTAIHAFLLGLRTGRGLPQA
ncbi:hypothetical protein [uncultured Dysosmobacter sp.]|uniref:hypothetical protein n=1 Tax=uncultured Dysosmobacter sp. TaxID=2591384 RepID=UPI0026178716|nr:hypothetical protein [uncultured Dysosmobacter sp.]